MGMSANPDSAAVRGDSVAAAVLCRAPLVMVTAIFTMIAFRYLSNTVHAAAEAGIGFTSSGGVTVARVGFAGFPLAIAILTFTCLLSKRRLLTGLYLALTVTGVVTAVRLFSMAVDHSAETARLLAPEFVLIALSIVAIRLEKGRRRRVQEAGSEISAALNPRGEESIR